MKNSHPILYLIVVIGCIHCNQLSATESTTTAPLSAICQEAEAIGCNWHQWRQKYGKVYAEQDFEHRHEMFCSNCVQINKTATSGYTLALNQFADLTDAEKEAFNGPPLSIAKLQKDSTHSRTDSVINQKLGVNIPPTLDYRNFNGQNYVTPVKDQGSCGSCWAFAATSSYQSAAILRGINVTLSDEAALECTTAHVSNGRTSDCLGGYIIDALTLLANVGSVRESSYPYIAGNYGSNLGHPTSPGICQQTNRVFLGGIVDLWAVPGGLSVSEIKALLMSNGPLAITIYANSNFFSYSSGTYTGCPSNAVNFINHAILLVGWTSTGWIAKNQWGTGWGNNGYIQLDFVNDCGMKYYMGSVLAPAVSPNSNNTIPGNGPVVPGSSWSGWVGCGLLLMLLFLL